MSSTPTAKPRYAKNAIAWFLHDFIVHPATGVLGGIGRLFGSYRIMALAHHIHNASAPDNDVMADYAESACRAGHNETASNPTGSMTPDEQDWARKAYRKVTGDDEYIQGQHAQERLNSMGIKTFNRQAYGESEPQGLSFEGITPEVLALAKLLSTELDSDDLEAIKKIVAKAKGKGRRKLLSSDIE